MQPKLGSDHQTVNCQEDDFWSQESEGTLRYSRSETERRWHKDGKKAEYRLEYRNRTRILTEHNRNKDRMLMKIER